SWAAPRPRATLVSLSPLTDNESEDLIDGLMHEGDVAAGLRDRIVGAAEGNPLFVEQMLAMLADDPHAADEAVPATIHALLAARIDLLEPVERAVLQRGSVEGRLFHRGAVAELLSSHGADGLGGILLALTRKELLRPDRSLFEGDDARSTAPGSGWRPRSAAGRAGSSRSSPWNAQHSSRTWAGRFAAPERSTPQTQLSPRRSKMPHDTATRRPNSGRRWSAPTSP